jgi:hypothetical protein
MIITRAWAMPSADTFGIEPINRLIWRYFSGRVVDPFCRNSPFKAECVSNDLDATIKADYNLDALAFLHLMPEAGFDLCLFDPPYSPRQVSECYKQAGLPVNMQTTQASFWSAIKAEIGRIVKPGGYCITCGWNSGGVGVKYGFEIIEILLVAHGGWHNDTIVTVEKRQKGLFDT